MGDGFTGTIVDWVFYFLLFGGVPFFALAVPLFGVPWCYRCYRRYLRSQSERPESN